MRHPVKLNSFGINIRTVNQVQKKNNYPQWPTFPKQGIKTWGYISENLLCFCCDNVPIWWHLVNLFLIIWLWKWFVMIYCLELTGNVHYRKLKRYRICITYKHNIRRTLGPKATTVGHNGYTISDINFICLDF